jgi:hypothetical protein
MGLGKTLTVIALILTNFHEGRPLSKPDIGYVRPPTEAQRATKKGTRKRSAAGAGTLSAPDLSGIGSKIKKNTGKKSIYNFFDRFKVNRSISVEFFLVILRHDKSCTVPSGRQ